MLKEFDLDAPLEPKPVRMRFRSETRYVTALFEKCYAPSKSTGKAWKVLVEVVATPPRETVIDLLGVLTVEVNGDVSRYFDLPATEKAERTLELLMSGVEKLAALQSLDILPFRDAAAEVRRRGFKNEWIWRKPIRNKTRSMVAEIVVEHGVNQAEISARFTDASGKVVRNVHLVSDAPSEFAFSKYLGSFGWLDETTVELVSRDGQLRFPASCN